MKKHFFMIMSIIQIAILLFTISIVPQIVEQQMQAMEESKNLFSSMFVEIEDQTLANLNEDVIVEDESEENSFDAMFDSMDEMLSPEYYERFYYFICIILIIFNLVILELASQNHILKHKNRVLAYEIITLLFGINIIISFMAIAEAIIVCCLKPESDEDYPVKAKKVEPLPYEYHDSKNKIKAVVLILSYSILHFAIPSLLSNFVTDFSKTIVYLIITVVLDILLFVLSIYLYKDELKAGWNAFKENKKGYKKFILIMLAISYACVMVLNLIRIVLTGNAFSENQAGLNDLPLLYIGVLAVFWAPIVEELVFRASLRRFIKNKYIFIVVSAVIFGVLHAISEKGTFNIFISSLPYVALGVCLATCYTRSNNILTDIAHHAINNLVAVIMMALVFGI